jgi:DNA-binding transcriptional regulator GbsR (MarR family)
MSKFSVETFIEQTENGNIRSAKVRVYRVLKIHGHSTLDHLRRTMGMSHQTLTARLSELMDMGVVWQSEKNEFYLTKKDMWTFYSDLRTQQRFQKWLKAGEKEGFTAGTTFIP